MALVSKLVHGFHQDDAQIVNLLKFRHVWFIPYLNLDGYKYIQSYTGDISDIESLVKNRNSFDCSDLQTGVNLANNYDYQWGTDTLGSSDVEWEDHYRGSSANSEAEVTSLISLFESSNSPTLILNLESGSNYIKYPNNYINDEDNIALQAQSYYWFYEAIVRDAPHFNLDVDNGNYKKLELRPNNGDNDDYFRHSRATNSLTWSLGSSIFGPISLSQYTQPNIYSILSENIDYGLYLIEKSGFQIYSTVSHMDVCIPTTQECDGYVPEDGNWKYFIQLDVYNSGLRDLSEQSEIIFSMSNDKMSLESDEFITSSRRNLNVVQSSIIKSEVFSQESDVITFQAIIDHSTSGDDLKSADSFGDFEVTFEVYGYTIPGRIIAFDSYGSYKSTLDRFYVGLMEYTSYQLFVAFWLWFVIHGVLLGLQIKFDLIRMLFKVKAKQENDEEAEEVVWLYNMMLLCIATTRSHRWSYRIGGTEWDGQSWQGY